MKNWKTQEIVDLLKDDNWKITVCSPGGDWDTQNLVLTHKAAGKNKWTGGRISLFIAGYRDLNEPTITDIPVKPIGSDADIYAIYVTDGMDSRGGLNTSDEPTAMMYAVVCARLRKAGFLVTAAQEQ